MILWPSMTLFLKMLTRFCADLALRFAIAICQIRDGTGLGIFAVQYGQRRDVFADLAQAF